MTAYIIPSLLSGETLPDAEALTTWGNPGEEQLYEDPHLVSWQVADNLVDGSGNYADRGPRGMNGLQATVGSQPSLFTRTFTDPVTGLSVSRKAWSFDGSGGQIIPLNYELPPGPMSLLVVCDIDPSVGTGDGVIHTLLGSTLDNTSARYAFQMFNRTFRFFNTSGASTASAAQAVSTPLLVIFSVDPLSQSVGIRINGGAWVVTTPASPSDTSNLYSNRDATGQIGFGGGASGSTGNPYKGHIYSEIVVNTALHDSAETARLSLYETTLRLKHALW